MISKWIRAEAIKPGRYQIYQSWDSLGEYRPRRKRKREVERCSDGNFGVILHMFIIICSLHCYMNLICLLHCYILIIFFITLLYIHYRFITLLHEHNLFITLLHIHYRLFTLLNGVWCWCKMLKCKRYINIDVLSHACCSVLYLGILILSCYLMYVVLLYI